MTAAALACLAVGYAVAFVGACVGSARTVARTVTAPLRHERNPLHGP